MQTKLILKPGQKGTKKLVNKFGDRLVCVRYRYDEKLRKRFKTVEIVVDEIDWYPVKKAPQPELVFVRICYNEKKLREQVKAAGGIWQPDKKLWVLPHHIAVKLKIKDRIIS